MGLNLNESARKDGNRDGIVGVGGREGCEEGLRVSDSDQKSRRHSIYRGWNLMEGEGEGRKEEITKRPESDSCGKLSLGNQWDLRARRWKDKD